MTAAPTFLSSPCLVVGIPVFLATFCLKAVMPTALLRENDNPGIFMAIYFIVYLNSCMRLIVSGWSIVGDVKRILIRNQAVVFVFLYLLHPDAFPA